MFFFLDSNLHVFTIPLGFLAGLLLNNGLFKPFQPISSDILPLKIGKLNPISLLGLSIIMLSAIPAFLLMSHNFTNNKRFLEFLCYFLASFGGLLAFIGIDNTKVRI